MASPSPEPPKSSGNPASDPGLRGGRTGFRAGREPAAPRLPLLMRILAVISLCVGLWGAVFSLDKVMGSLVLDRTAFVLRVRDSQLIRFDQLQAGAQTQASKRPEDPVSRFVQSFFGPFLKLSRDEAGRLSLLLGDALYERRGVTVPLSILELLLCWLLLSGSVATLRRQSWGLSTWSFACWASISFALLSMLVTFVHSRTLMARLSEPVAAALAQANGESVELSTARLWQLTRLYVVARAGIEGLWVLLLGLTALYLQRYVHQIERRGGIDRADR